ncbi:MAG TPA: M14 family metallopeptidase [Burkholderiaceae bacterium]|nr:M14 family metallopeptidase [Burkholderiaceae bacterium]
MRQTPSSTATPAVSQHFSSSYREAREKFQAAAARRGLAAQAHVHPAQRGAEGEELAMDVLRIGPADARSLLVVTSATHGVEGFCGSGCQIALLHDDELLARAERSGTALLLVHAVNPYGFSHLRRVNEDSIDLNRNFLDYSAPLPQNPAYADVHPLMLPAQWPPTADDEAAVEGYIATHGARRFQSAVSSGQSTHPDGLFYAGLAPAWSNTTLRSVLRAHAASCAQLAWIDIHTGLGPLGHGEKIFGGRNDPAELARARACWGADVFSPFTGDSFSEVVRGAAASCVYDECPGAKTIAIGLEFGTVAFMDIMEAMRADQWLTNHPKTPESQRRQIKQALRDAFCIDSPEWRGMVTAQTRVAVLQALSAFS